MEDWIYKPDLQSDWMSLIFLLNLLIILILYKLDQNRLKSLINIFKLRIYFGKHSHEKELNYFSYFNLCCFILVVSTLTLTYFSFSTYSLIPLYYDFEYYYLLLGLSSFLIVRYLFTKFIFNQLGIFNKIKLTFYRSFTFTSQTSIFLIGLIFLWNYSSLPLILIESVLFLLALYWIISQFNVYFLFLKLRPKDIIYLILYLCTFKLAPWIWIYLFFLEQNYN